jgi:serine/threonine protein phosphatase PrpC
MLLDIAYTQHQGKNWRYPQQQDALWNGMEVFQARNLRPAQQRSHASTVTLAVADGVGSSPQAQRASLAVLQALAQAIASGAAFDMGLLRKVHGQLCDQLARGATFGSATTLAAVQIANERCTVMNVGDSRVYRISADGQWQQLSHDHTVLNAMIARGEAEAGVEYAHIYHMLDACLAADNEDTGFDIHRCTATLQPGDALLLCTDGVHDTLDASTLQGLHQAARSPLEQVQTWRRAVLAAGAPDNFSMVFCRL